MPARLGAFALTLCFTRLTESYLCIPGQVQTQSYKLQLLSMLLTASNS